MTVAHVTVEIPALKPMPTRIVTVTALVPLLLIHVMYVPTEIPDTLLTAIGIVTVTALVPLLLMTVAFVLMDLPDWFPTLTNWVADVLNLPPYLSVQM